MNTTRFAELRVLEDMIVLVRLQLQELARTHGRSRLYHGTNQPLFELAVGRHTALVGPTWNCRDRVLLRYAGWSSRTRIGDIFNSMMSFFKSYTGFAGNFEHAMAAIAENPAFILILQLFITNKLLRHRHRPLL